MERNLKILIADDFDAMRQVMLMLLRDADMTGQIDEAPTLESALESAESLGPDVILMNDYLPPIDSAHAAKMFRRRGITAAILVVSMTVEPELIERSLASGVNGFMHKEEMGEHLIEAVREVYNGRRYLSPRARRALS